MFPTRSRQLSSIRNEDAMTRVLSWTGREGEREMTVDSRTMGDLSAAEMAIERPGRRDASAAVETSRSAQHQIGRLLRVHFSDLAETPVPDSLRRLVERLAEREAGTPPAPRAPTR